MSFSTVDHLRWDLHAIFSLAVDESHIAKNPARLLVTPKGIRNSNKSVMTIQQVKQCFSALSVRDRLIVKLAVLGGMRSGEILALRWNNLKEGEVDVRQRLYRNDLDVPKTRHSVRKVALPDGVGVDLQSWREISANVGPEAWVFPSET